MECPNCQQDNSPGSRFCTQCGIALPAQDVAVACPNCRQENPPGAGFCSNCGTALAVGCPSCSRGDVGDGRFCRWCKQLLVGPRGVKAAGIGQRVGAYVLDIVLFFLTLFIGYIIWWLFTLRRGQTPGKQLVGIRVVRTDGTASDWGWTFIREFLIKFALFEVAVDLVSFGLGSFINLLWAFWDKDRQTLHDKIMNTVVVDDRVFLSEARSAAPAAT